MTQAEAAFARLSVAASRVDADPARILDFVADRLEAELTATGAEFSAPERHYFDQYGGLAARGEDETPFSELVGRQAAIDATRFESTKSIASLLGIDESRVRHRRGAGDLVAYKMGRNLRYPRWQLMPGPAGSVPLPGLKKLLAVLPDAMHPAEIAGRMLLPQAALEINGRSVSPRDWLIAGGEADALREVFEDDQTW